MAVYCEYCGQVIETGARFCACCGAPAPIEQTSTENTVSGQGATIVSGSGDYSVILISLGTCAKAAAADLLEDTLGYAESDSADLFSMLPAQIAQKLTRDQANYLAQAMTEYGMEVSVNNGSEYVTVDDTSDTQSVFDKGGSFLGKVISVLGTITGLNRMRKFRRLDDPRSYARPYRPQTYQPTPPVHVRRNTHTAAPQKPVHTMPQVSHAEHNPQHPQGGRPVHSQQPGNGRMPSQQPGNRTTSQPHNPGRSQMQGHNSGQIGPGGPGSTGKNYPSRGR